jgi:DNA polymerase sigma
LDKAILIDSEKLAAGSTENPDIAAKKYRALGDFIGRLLHHQVGDRVLKLILFGSLPRGEANEESDIDLLVISAGNLRKIDEICGDLAFDVLMDCGELVH